MSKTGGKRDPLILVLDLIIILMIFVILAVGCILFFYMHVAGRTGKFTQDASMMSFELSRNDYASMIQGKYINEFNGNVDAKTYHALADYVEALSQYKIYVEKGYVDKAREQEEIMQRAREEMGDLTLLADKADAMFAQE